VLVPPINVVFTGATGHVGRTVVPAIIRHPDYRLVGAVGRRRAGQDVGLALGMDEPAGVRLVTDVHEALGGSGAQVLIDYSAPEPAVAYCRAAVEAGVAVVMATTAMDPAAVEEIGRIAARNGVGAFLAPNLTLSGQLMFRCAELIRRYVGDVEIVEAHTLRKLDAPSGTSLETAERLNRVPGPPPSEDLTRLGMAESRGAQVGGVRIHSLRVANAVDTQEVIFSRPGEIVAVRCEILSPEVYVEPTLTAARLVLGARGLVHELPGLFDTE
jgi:4-hydroxy-tetrahydrodipicolinate reductase